MGAGNGAASTTISLSVAPKTATYLRACDEHPGVVTLVSDGEVLTGAYGLGPAAGEWMQQATVALRARLPLEVLNDTTKRAQPQSDQSRPPGKLSLCGAQSGSC